MTKLLILQTKGVMILERDHKILTISTSPSGFEVMSDSSGFAEDFLAYCKKNLVEDINTLSPGELKYLVLAYKEANRYV